MDDFLTELFAVRLHDSSERGKRYSGFSTKEDAVYFAENQTECKFYEISKLTYGGQKAERAANQMVHLVGSDVIIIGYTDKATGTTE